VIQPGDSGIWATCNRGQERKCIGELRDLFTEYAELLYGTGEAGDTIEASVDANAEPSSANIESEINAEVAEMQHPSSAQLFTPIRVDIECVVFFKTVAPVEPVSFVKRICEDALASPSRKRTRYTKRLSPITLMGRATEEGMEKVARAVLEPYFHQTPVQPRKVWRRKLHYSIKVVRLTRNALVRHSADTAKLQHDPTFGSDQAGRWVCGFWPYR
jgi:tRNA acetyltransferase TAN1